MLNEEKEENYIHIKSDKKSEKSSEMKKKKNQKV